MSSVKPKRRKIPYIGKPLTASEIRAAFPLTPEEQAIVDRAIEKVRERRSHGRRTKHTSAKTARVK